MSEWRNRPTLEPELIGESPISGKKYTHKAFGQITLNTTSGARTLYDVDYVPHGYITISIHTSELHRSLSSDRHYAKGSILEINMSHAQWVNFVSSSGQGAGTPCTIEHIDGHPMPLIAATRHEKDEIKTDVKETLLDSIRRLTELRDKISADEKLPKTKQKEFVWDLNLAIQELVSNVPFVVQQFHEHVEDTLEKAKTEVHSYMNMAINRAGLQTLQDKSRQELIEGPPEE